MKYLLLLLVLAGCAKEKLLTAEEQEIARKNLAFRDQAISNFYNPQSVVLDEPPEYIVRDPLEPINYELPGNHEEPEEPETIPMPEGKYNLYLTNINPHREKYKQFFEEQLKIYGRDDKGERLINLDAIRGFNIDTGFSFITFTSNGVDTTKLEIIEHGSTNYHPVPSNY